MKASQDAAADPLGANLLGSLWLPPLGGRIGSIGRDLKQKKRGQRKFRQPEGVLRCCQTGFRLTARR